MKVDWMAVIGFALIIGAICLLSQCQLLPPDEPPRPTPVVDVGPPDPPAPPGIDWCVEACANLERLHCPWAEPTSGEDGIIGTTDDGTCAKVCHVAEEEQETTMHPACVSTAKSCDEAEGCVQ